MNIASLSIRRLIHGILIAVACQAGIAVSDEPDGRGLDKESVKRWMSYYKQIAHGYDIRLDDHRDEKLKPSAEAIHSFVNRAHDNKQTGAFFVWTREGRPEVIGAMWSYLVAGKRRVAHDLHSLSLGSLTGKWEGKVLWRPKTAGIELTAVPKAEPPAKTAPLRLAQMRAMARAFKGHVVREKESLLRNADAPLYRYETSGTEVIDGAIFALFEEWDPEILVLLEARAKGGTTAWSFAPIRFSEARLTLHYGEDKVWDDPAKEFFYSDRSAPFYAPRVEDLDAELKTLRRE